MKFPTLSFEINYLKDLIYSENKIQWLKDLISAEYVVSQQISFFTLIGVIIFTVIMIYNSISLEGATSRNTLIRIITLPITIPLIYYLLKLIAVWTMWVSKLGWWSIPVILITCTIIVALVLFWALKIDDD
jgi:hypothetical protein